MNKEHLYSPADVKRIREKLLKDQKGIDPITKQIIPDKQAVLDHDHVTQNCRATLERNTNAFEGLVFNAYKRCLSWQTDKTLPEILRNLADYLETDYSHNPYHVGFIKALKVQFNKLSEKQKDAVLVSLGSEKKANSVQRKAQFAKLIMTRQYTYEQLIKEINNAKETN